MMAPGTTSMLRARRRDENLKPNRRLDRKSSRGMLYENEELRLRTININAEVERGQNDIKKLRRENEHLRREIWGLREQYDKLEGLLGKAKMRGSQGEGDDTVNEEECEEEDLEYDDEDDDDDDDEADLDNAENQQKASSSSRSRRNSVRVVFDGLSVVDEETDEEAICDSGNSKHKHEQQFFGKIKLPNGREGVFMSDGMLPNSNGVQVCEWPEQSYYNYTFAPFDSATRIPNVQEGDGYFGTVNTGDFFHRRGGPDLFISGAYPVAMSPTTFPPGGNLDQLLNQMNEKQSEIVPSVQIMDIQHQPQGSEEIESQKNVQEVIDALESQLDTKLEDAVKGVRALKGNYFVCLNNEDNINALLDNGLNIQGQKVTLECVSRGIAIVTASGIPYDISDEKLTKALAQYGCIKGDIERRFYKGVDTGERVIKLKPHDRDIPTSITIADSKIELQVSKPTDAESNGETCPKPEIPSKPLGNSFTTDRFRSQINVRLKQPNPKGNRSLDNLLDTNTSKELHNTSLPIINAFDNDSPVQEKKSLTEDKANQPSAAESTCLQPILTNLNKDLPNIFSETPSQKSKYQTLQSRNTTDESGDSTDVFSQQTTQFQNNPFLGGFQTSTPVSHLSVNPFVSCPNYTQQPLHQYVASPDYQRHLFLPETTNNPRVCSPYPKLTMPTLPYSSPLSNSGLPSPALTPQTSPQINRIPNFPFDNPNYFPNPAIHGSSSNPGIFLPKPYFHGDMSSNPHNIAASNPVPNAQPPQPSSNISQTAANQSSQNVTNEDNKEHETKHKTSDVKKSEVTSTPSSPVSERRKKASIVSNQPSKSSGDEGVRASPGSGRKKFSRKPSSTNSIRSFHNVEASGGPNATSSPNTKHKSSADHSRKASVAMSSNSDPAGGGHTNVIDVSRSSSSGQDSPTKPNRRRRVSIYFNNKKGAKRRDSVFVPNGAIAPGAGILTRSLSLDTAHRYTGGSTTDVAGAETTICSERERTNSASSRTSSATGTSRLRKHSECSNRGSSINDVGKVPWCACWGNGCL